jgi:diguanylate cyclase (GGDEF)-like protein
LTKCEQVPFNRWLCEKAATTKEIQLNDCIDECYEAGVEGTSPHGLYCIPIISSSKVLGVLTLCVKEDHQPKQEKIDFLRGISNILAGIIERRQLEVKLDNLAHFDVLTNIHNRNMFSVSMNQLLALAKRNNRKLSLLFLDLDGFKAVNDSYGHDIGDLLLKEVSKKFKSCLRSSDLIIRMGGDEFTIILSEIVDEQYAAVIAQRIIDSIKSPFHLSGQECSIGVSIGISLYPLNSDNVETLLKYADIAMYRAKEDSGSSFQFYTPEMGSKVTETTDNEG